TKDYWLINSNANILVNRQFGWGRDNRTTSAPGMLKHTSNFSTLANGGSSWIGGVGANVKPCFAFGRYRAQSFIATDPKAVAETGSGYTAGGIPVNTVISSTLTTIP